MLHIFLMILKIIGIILAVLLGLVLLLLLLVLFVPIRYKGKLQREKEPEVTARITWLLHMISVPVTFRDGVLSVKIKLFGIMVKKLMGDKEELDEDADEFFHDVKDTARKEEKKIEEMEEQEASPPDSSDEETEGLGALEGGEKGDRLKEDEEEPSESEMPKQAKNSLIKRIFYKIKAFFLKIFGIWKKIKNLKYTFRKFCGKIKKAIQKYRDTKEFLLDERTRGAVCRLLKEGKLLLRKLLPRRIRGELRFGTKDPALTGEILGGISIFYPIFMDNVKVYPDFEKSILEGELFVKGRFQLVTVALILWRLWRDKNIRYVYHKFHEGE